jgi:hypothetical protein
MARLKFDIGSPVQYGSRYPFHAGRVVKYEAQHYHIRTLDENSYSRQPVTQQVRTRYITQLTEEEFASAVKYKMAVAIGSVNANRRSYMYRTQDPSRIKTQMRDVVQSAIHRISNLLHAADKGKA